jgi:hypothetical protein
LKEEPPPGWLFYFKLQVIRNMKYPFNFYTSYHQFYIVDKGSEGNTASSTFWTDNAYNDRLAIENGILGVGTECYGPVKGELELLTNINITPDLSTVDHVVEAGIAVNSGIIQLLDCPTSTIQLEIKVAPGNYGVRIYSSNLSSVDGEEGDDFYRIEIWPDENMTGKVSKRYV